MNDSDENEVQGHEKGSVFNVVMDLDFDVDRKDGQEKATRIRRGHSPYCLV